MVTETPLTPIPSKYAKLLATTNLKNLMPVTLDVDKLNYSNWSALFLIQLRGFRALEFVQPPASSSDTTTPPPPPTDEWLTVDSIIQSWILSTISESLLEPTAKDIWDTLERIDSVASRLDNLGSNTTEDDLVMYAINGLSDKYDQVAYVILTKQPFPNLEDVRSMLSLAETRMNRKNSSSSSARISSSSPTALVAQYGSARSQGNITRPTPSKSTSACRNFSRGFCSYGDRCRFVHGSSRGNYNGNSNSANGSYNNNTWSSNGSRSNIPSQMGHDSLLEAYTQLLQAHQRLLSQSTLIQAHVDSQDTVLPQAFSTLTLQDFGDAGWNMDTCASLHLNSNANNLSSVFNEHINPSVFVGDGASIPVTNTGHSVLPSPYKPLHLNHVLVTPHIVKNLISVRKFTRDNKCTIEFDEFGFSVKDYSTRQTLLRCDSTGDLYPVTKPTNSPKAFVTSQHTWHQRLGHPGSDVLRSLISSNSILCNKTKSPVLCHACQLGKHVRLPFESSDSIVDSPFDIVHSDLWTSPLLSISRNPTTNSVPTHPMVTRLRLGIRQPNPKYNCHVSTISPIPKSYNAAFTDPNWKNAMLDEYNALIKNKTWILVPRPSNTNIVRSMWLFKHKHFVDGSLSRYKVRLVANGHSQQIGIDCDETFSPVVKPTTICTVLSLAASRHWPVHQLDVKNAFLHGHLSETVYMHQPPCYATRVGFAHSRCDSSLFIYHRGTDIAYLLIYVDDIILTASSATLLHRIIASLHNEFLMTDLGSFHDFLGISVSRDAIGMFLCQRKYALEILERVGMLNCHSCPTPVDTEFKLGDDGPMVCDPTLYRSLAGSLQYLTFTRLDFSYAVQQVCLFMHDPREQHLAALKRILRYVWGTLDYGLQFFLHLLFLWLVIPMQIGQVALPPVDLRPGIMCLLVITCYLGLPYILLYEEDE
ncbi:ribonuclease H-like domain-containing protein [Tanacetum coccineum]